MNLKDKIGLWADNEISRLYFERVPFQALREWTLGLLVPVCGHKDHKIGEECKERGEPCWMPDYEESGEEVIYWVCYKHMHVEGFCKGCRQFWAGCEDFDFDPHGLCSNCRHDPDVTGDDDYEPEGWEEAMFEEGLP